MKIRDALLTLSALIAAGLIILWTGHALLSVRHLRAGIETRPRGDTRIADLAGILSSSASYAERYLHMVEERYGIQVMIVTLPSLGTDRTIEEAAVEIMNSWGIGRRTGGKGVLVLFSVKEKAVKMEVSYELEDVFTDLFCGYVADIQLRPHFLNGRTDTALIALVEELEKRSRIKSEGGYTHDFLARLDTELVSGGGGVTKDLGIGITEKTDTAGYSYPPGRTPAEAWRTMVTSWRNKVRDPLLGVYTRVTRLIYRDHRNTPDARFEENVRIYGTKPYEILRNGNYAVVYFGAGPGWENAPFLLHRDGEGWKFDMVRQRKLVRMGPNPQWGVEWVSHPYIDLLSRCPAYDGLDIPLPPEDTCSNEEDQRISLAILSWEARLSEKPHDPEALAELGRLYSICAMGAKAIPVLEKARQLRPDDPRPDKYLAVAHVDAYYQYAKALSAMEDYVRKLPRDPFGWNFLAYLHGRLGDTRAAVGAYEKAIALQQNNCYAYSRLSEIYLYRAFEGGGKKPRASNTRQAVEYFRKASASPGADLRRISRLRGLLEKKGIPARELD